MHKIINFEFFKMLSFMLNEKELNLGPQLPYIGLFGIEFEKKKTVVTFEISTLKSIKNEFLINIASFGAGFAFSEDPVSRVRV